MRKIVQVIVVVSFGVILTPLSFGQETNNVSELTGGITFTDGVFYPTYSIQGMTYNAETKSYQMPQESSSSTPPAVVLPDSAPLITAYNAAENKEAYFEGLSALEKASLFLNIPSGSDKSAMLNTFKPSEADTTNVADFRANRTLLRDFLLALPADQVADAINGIPEFYGRAYPGAPSYYGDRTHGALYGMSLAGINLAGWNTAGKSLIAINFVGSNITGAQLAASTDFFGPTEEFNTDLSGCNVTGFLANGVKSLTGVNLANSNVTAAELSNVELTRNDLRGVNLAGWASNRPVQSVNLAGVDLSQAQVNSVTAWNSSNLSGANLTNFNPTGTLTGVNMAGATGLTAQALVNSGGWNPLWYGTKLILTGTGITSEALESAINAAGKSGNANYRLSDVVF